MKDSAHLLWSSEADPPSLVSREVEGLWVSDSIVSSSYQSALRLAAFAQDRDQRLYTLN
jgi:hypothetical protein